MKEMRRADGSTRSAGVLLHVTSLPGGHGIGDLGPAAHRFVDLLARAKQAWWQVLPLNPPAQSGCPYQAYSAFAGDPLLISLDMLAKEKLIRRPEIPVEAWPDDRIDFARVAAFKAPLLVLAWQRFNGSRRHEAQRREFARFRRQQRHWLEDYALFVALKNHHGVATSWVDWPKGLARRKASVMEAARAEFAGAIDRAAFEQFLFARQLAALRTYARDKGVKLLGDLPIYVSHESADVWASPAMFELDRDGRPKAVAGVPPDLFSEDGQRWGNPLYNWRAMAREGFLWWLDRARATLAQVDLVRLDHFRAFAAYWRIPADQPTARNGKWVKAPGRELFEALRKALNGLPFVAEDLGLITPDVEALRDDFALPGMRILQFAFGSGHDNPFLPHNHVNNAIAYTGTHDNDTTAGWFKTLDERARSHLLRYAPDAKRDPAWALIRLTMSSVADTAIVPLQDVLRLGSDARVNTPGTSEGNWSWRVRASQLRPGVFDRLGALTETFGRGVNPRG
jgi:4-alpha-glucanotransferase